MRRWSGIIAREGTQTGDGRVIADGALEWEVPFELEWNPDDQGSHCGIQVVGMVETAARNPDGGIAATGILDDESGAGVELVRLMSLDPPLASGLSIVMDDMAIELLVRSEDIADDEIIVASILASGRSVFGAPRQTLFGAAGDPDPATDEDYEVVMEMAQDDVIERVTRARIRAATLVDVPAFIDARITLETEETVAASPAVVASPPVRPPSGWFKVPEPEDGDDRYIDQDDGRIAIPLTILDSGQVYGHANVEGKNHIGYPGLEVTPPTSLTAYREFHLGHVICDDGLDISTGPLIAACDHALRDLRAPEARDHYAHNAIAWADARAVDGQHGTWVCGALRPDVTDVQVRALRGGTLSGDWRDIGGNLEMIACQAVSTPGFAVYREQLAASAFVRPASGPQAWIVDGRTMSLVAPGLVSRCPECAERARVLAAAGGNGHGDPEVLRYLRTLELRTRHLLPAAAAHAAARLRR